MLSLIRYLSESFKNLLPQHEEEKHAHKHEVFSMITKAYESQGGIHGSGFESPDDMVKNIPMWKLSKKDGKVTSVSLYKNDKKTGRKLVAIASDGSRYGKKTLGDAIASDLKQKRSHMEFSGKALEFLKKQADITPHLHTFSEAEKYHNLNGKTIVKPDDNDPEIKLHPELKDHFYQREIGGEMHTKVLMGTVGKRIV